MIIATGIDIVDIDRLAAIVRRHGDAFLQRVCTPAELEAAPHAPAARDAYLAGRWAVKEAVAKALGTGIGEHCAMTDAEVLNDPAGRPVLTLHGAARKTADRLGIATPHISLSHARHLAVAHAIAER